MKTVTVLRPGATLYCPTCGHEVQLTAASEEARQAAIANLRSIGATLEGPYCDECHKAGRGDIALVERVPAVA